MSTILTASIDGKKITRVFTIGAKHNKVRIGQLNVDLETVLECKVDEARVTYWSRGKVSYNGTRSAILQINTLA